MSRLKIGIVGCGYIANNHFKALADLTDQFELTALCDTNQEILSAASNGYRVPGYTSLDAMLNAEPALDIVTLCSPSGLHAQQTVQIAQAQKHVITEKPMATRWSDGLSMVKACDAANVKLFVVKQNRYQPALQLLRQAFQKNRFGRLYMVNLNVFWTRPQTYYDQSKWRGTWEFDGGAFMNQACHYVDLLDWLIGPVQSVHAMMSTLARNMEAEDTGVLNLRWRSGALGSMNVTMLTYPKNLEASLTMLGENGSVRLGGLATDKIQHWDFMTPDPDDEQINIVNELPKASSHSNHKLYYENVADHLSGKCSADTNGRAGLRTLEILVAAYRSARDNITTNLPLVC